MGHACNGRCERHRTKWAQLEQAAGVKPKGSGGRLRYYADSQAREFLKALSEKYDKQWDKLSGRDPHTRPTRKAVAEDEFLWCARTLRRTMQRLGARWPPPPPGAVDLEGRARGTARADASLTRRSVAA